VFKRQASNEYLLHWILANTMTSQNIPYSLSHYAKDIVIRSSEKCDKQQAMEINQTMQVITSKSKSNIIRQREL